MNRRQMLLNEIASLLSSSVTHVICHSDGLFYRFEDYDLCAQEPRLGIKGEKKKIQPGSQVYCIGRCKIYF